MPPRVDDRSRPDRAYETFRGALARDEFPREFECLDDSLARQFGGNRAKWNDLRTSILTSSHIVVRGIKRSKVKTVRKKGVDQAYVDLSFPFGITGWVLMRRHTVVRIYVEGSDRPLIYEIVPRRNPGLDTLNGTVSFEFPPGDVDLWAEVLQEEGKAVRKFEWDNEWFLEDFKIGGKTPKSTEKERKEKEAES